MKYCLCSVLEEVERAQVLERAEEVDSTVDFKVPEMDVQSWRERERSEFELHSEHLKITGRILKEKTSQSVSLLILIS